MGECDERNERYPADFEHENAKPIFDKDGKVYEGLRSHPEEWYVPEVSVKSGYVPMNDFGIKELTCPRRDQTWQDATTDVHDALDMITYQKTKEKQSKPLQQIESLTKDLQDAKKNPGIKGSKKAKDALEMVGMPEVEAQKLS